MTGYISADAVIMTIRNAESTLTVMTDMWYMMSILNHLPRHTKPETAIQENVITDGKGC